MHNNRVLFCRALGFFFKANEAQVPLSNAESPQCRTIDGVTIETFQISAESENGACDTMAAEIQQELLHFMSFLCVTMRCLENTAFNFEITLTKHEQ
jgi:hypothetical protein